MRIKRGYDMEPACWNENHLPSLQVHHVPCGVCKSRKLVVVHRFSHVNLREAIHILTSAELNSTIWHHLLQGAIWVQVPCVCWAVQLDALLAPDKRIDVVHVIHVQATHAAIGIPRTAEPPVDLVHWHGQCKAWDTEICGESGEDAGHKLCHMSLWKISCRWLILRILGVRIVAYVSIVCIILHSPKEIANSDLLFVYTYGFRIIDRLLFRNHFCVLPNDPQQVLICPFVRLPIQRCINTSREAEKHRLPREHVFIVELKGTGHRRQPRRLKTITVNKVAPIVDQRVHVLQPDYQRNAAAK
mmetsp:Transcript_74206/g.135480  ORF Transcript_74206/g.135480 Transcript_74206/m.135480 type:complete len:301 (-) Transcript_74206:30-932(-)